VDFFYNKKYADAARRLKLLNDQYGKSINNLVELDRDEVEDLVGALLELRGNLRNVQWYGEVNRRGFVKITKKLDKKVPNHQQRQYVETKVDLRPFATNNASNALLRTANDWLSKAGDIKTFDDKSSEHSTRSLSRVSAKAILNLPQGVLDTVDQAIRSDDAPILVEVLQEANTTKDEKDPQFQRLLLNLLQRSFSCRSKDCIAKLLKMIATLEESDDINGRNCLHRFVISMSRSKAQDDVANTDLDEEARRSRNGNYITPATAPTISVPARVSKEVEVEQLGREHKSVAILVWLLEHLSVEQRPALQARDSSGRMPLHYAAQHGFVVIVQIIISHMQRWDLFELENSIDAPFFLDSDGLAPLHLSIIGGHFKTTKALLEAEEWRGAADRSAAVRKHMGKAGEVLAMATRDNLVEIVGLLVYAGVDINYRDDQGETALHVAARYGHKKCAITLLAGSDDNKADTEVAETTFGWTPLFVACVDGNLDVTELLIEAGANLTLTDLSGWTAQEHAALRGHINIAEKLAEHMPSTRKHSLESSTAITASLADRKSNGNINGNAPRIPEPVKTFGHRYLTNESLILVSLGTMDNRKNTEAVTLDRIPLAHAHLTQLDTALSLVVSASGAVGEPSIVDLPVQENISTEPITFTTRDASKVKLLFDIVPTYAGSKDHIVGRGVALLGSIKPSIGGNRMTLQGDVVVPIVAAHNLDVIGNINFNFLVITPFTHPNMSIAEDNTYWRSMTSPMVIGHRGLGKNQAARKSLQLGENTIQSFIAAASLGASYVEFDVQLTKDHVPVIYHDFLVSETGIDAPVHTLTLEQFVHLNDGRTPRPSRPSSPANTAINGLKAFEQRKGRSMSVGTKTDHPTTDEMSERMKHTRDFKEKGFKGNSRGNFIQAPFATLEQMFKQLPAHIGFNVEMKYPMLFESEEQEMDTYAVELNSFVDTVLTKVYDLAKSRNIIFSSFNPDICLLLSFKQPSIPVLFLTDAGTSPVGDIRASSLQEAIRFASRWNLLGVVSAAVPLCLSPRLVKVVKESGLVCVSYGTLNNDPEKVKLQVQEGIDAVIVDSVLAIRKGLTGTEKIGQPEATGNDGSTNGARNNASQSADAADTAAAMLNKNSLSAESAAVSHGSIMSA
jgi:glycerophosphodiester phosphodiesterase